MICSYLLVLTAWNDKFTFYIIQLKIHTIQNQYRKWITGWTSREEFMTIQTKLTKTKNNIQIQIWLDVWCLKIIHVIIIVTTLMITNITHERYCLLWLWWNCEISESRASINNSTSQFQRRDTGTNIKEFHRKLVIVWL